MLLKKQRNEFFSFLQSAGLNSQQFLTESDEYAYTLRYFDLDNDYYFSVSEGRLSGFDIGMRPGIDKPYTESLVDKWDAVKSYFSYWAKTLYEELEAPDLWAEAAKTAQLFAPTSMPADDKFTRTELAEVQGQLRLLQQSFATAALPAAARQKLIELTQTAAVKAEGLTKKDWQNWLIGGFISAIASCALNPTQAGEVLKLVKAAFGGLFLH